MSSNDFFSKLIATFRVEADEHLQAMITGLLALENTATPEAQLPLLETIFREAHSLKGAARAVDLTEVEAVCQALEGVFARLKRGEMYLTPDKFDIVHRALDTVNALLAEPDQPHATEVAEAVSDLSSLEVQSSDPPSPMGYHPETVSKQTPQANQIDVVPPSTHTTPAHSREEASTTVASEALSSDQLSSISTRTVSNPVPSSTNDFLSKLIATFRLEADEHLKAMIAGVLTLEKGPEAAEHQELLEAIFRETHSLKGASRAVDLTDVEAVCQALESIFARLKRGEFQLSAEGFDAVHQAFDTIEALLNEPNEPHATQVAEAIQRLTRLEMGDSINVQQPSPSSQSLPQTPEQASRVAPRSQSTPVPQSPPAPTSPRSPVSRTSQQKAALGQNSQKGELPTSSSKPGTEDTVRVASSKLDSLFLQAEEMLATKLSVNQHITDLKDAMELLGEWRKEWTKVSSEVRKLQRLFEGKEDWARQESTVMQTTPALVNFVYWNEQQIVAIENHIKGLIKAAEHDQQTVGTLVDNLLENTKRVLTMPFSSLLEIFPKMVRDLSRSLGKEAELIIRGSEVEIDKRILEDLKAPLIHLLRNSLDHGIETPEVRAHFEKPSRGTIIINVSQTSGSSVEILISDDGGGIDRKKVTHAAVKKGLLSAQAAEALDEQAALALIFQSEVSTSPIVTDISGRGLGMAIVREKIEKLGGQISVETQLREGTSFRILVPLTLATFRGVFVEVVGRTFVIPTTNVERVTRIKRSEVKSIEGKETLILDGRPVALVHLDALLGLPHKNTQQHGEEILLTLILSAGDKRIACRVDEIDNEQEVLFKSLGSFLAHVPNVAGATVLGSGKVIPILHVPDLLITASEEGRTHSVMMASEGSHKESSKTVLIAEDSVTSRMLLKGILETAGYRVTTAVDGAEAFALLQKTPFDILVSDVEMPRMNGFELTTKVRSTEQLAQVPVVLVTGLDSREDRERGITAGADAYIVKTSFDQSNLLDVVQRLI
jgi:two-component system chemotaxis sensor kinase CheA